MPLLNCTHQGCGKSWDYPNGVFPLCINFDCPLRAQRNTLGRRAPQNEQFVFDRGCGSNAVLGREAARVSSSVTKLRRKSGKRFEPYDMKGKQSASTTVRFRDKTAKTFTTTDQMHSER